MTKNTFTIGLLASFLALQTGCSLISYPDTDTTVASCKDPLAYYGKLSAQDDRIETSKTEPAKTAPDTQSTTHNSEACYKLHEAIKFSMPDSKQQNDKRALVLLKELKQSKELSVKDQQFNNMLLQHVAQRQALRNKIGSQDEQLKKTETQIDQLQNIELEIDKKERSVTSPIDELSIENEP